MHPSHPATVYLVCALSLAGVLVRPWRTNEAVWALAGALALVGLHLVSMQQALQAVGKGSDVYMFLAGMMLLSQLARREGLFDWLAAVCVRLAAGSAATLLLLVYGAGVVVTVFMSNDATAVVLTPAVLAVARKAGAKPLPYLLACAFVANAASFLLPVSNPANLVIYQDKMPALAAWLRTFALPSVLSVASTYLVLRWLCRAALRPPIRHDIVLPELSSNGKAAGAGVVVTACAMMLASAFGIDLGFVTLGASCTVCALVLLRERQAPWDLLKAVSWPVMLLVGALFVLVEGIEKSGGLQELRGLLQAAGASSLPAAAAAAAAVTAVACNLVNNLPAGLLAGAVVAGGSAPQLVRGALTIGVDLGPNLSVTGSLATILWLSAIRSDGERVSGWAFMRCGLLAMPVALALAVAGLLLQNVVAGP